MASKLKSINTIKAAGKKRILNVRPDTPDLRDQYYVPALVQLKPHITNLGGRILDQESEGACTGFALAGVINLLSKERDDPFEASSRMLYEMAQKHDQWPGEDYEGSSCRGAINGWKNMGVCSDDKWVFKVDKPGQLTIERAMAARDNPLGAYYRLRPNIVDYHAALNEVDAIYVSARVHSGWFSLPKSDGTEIPVIQANAGLAGGHAFAIVGYNSLGFIVQNSWGKDWGWSGFAIWSYEDWHANVSDGWVFRLGLPTPTIFDAVAKTAKPSEGAEFFKRGPKRQEIAGHFAHFDDGKYASHGTYWTNKADIQQTAVRIKEKSDWYKHVLVYVHGGLNSPKASAQRIAALNDGFIRNRIYPFHIMYDTGLAESVKDVVFNAGRGAASRVEGFLDWIEDIKDQIVERTDTLIEDAARKPVTPLWEEMKRDARLPFDSDAPMPDGLDAIKTIAATLKGSGTKIHLAGHSTGGVLIGHLLKALDALETPDLLATTTLFAPACTIDFFRDHYALRLDKNYPGTRLPILDIYNLNEKLEVDDNVVIAYRKSLLYLVSNALEREKGKAILGMQRFSKELDGTAGLNLIYSNGKGKITNSESHGGFDNDTRTMNSLLKRILDAAPKKPFSDQEMKGY
ncbi:MAG: C1 family peptidase [Candidatus Reddybacter sp.]